MDESNCQIFWQGLKPSTTELKVVVYVVVFVLYFFLGFIKLLFDRVFVGGLRMVCKDSTNQRRGPAACSFTP